MTSPFKKNFMKVPKIPFLDFYREIGRNAFVDWLLILIVNTLIALGMATGGAYLYWQISSGNFTTEVTNSSVPKKVINEKDLKSIISLFDDKVENSQQIKRGYRGPGDPSL